MQLALLHTGSLPPVVIVLSLIMTAAAIAALLFIIPRIEGFKPNWRKYF